MDLKQLNLTANDTGVLRPRGFPGGGGAGIAVWRFEPSAAELFFRRPASAGRAGRGQQGSADAQMRLARFPNLAQPGKPSSAGVSCDCKSGLLRQACYLQVQSSLIEGFCCRLDADPLCHSWKDDRLVDSNVKADLAVARAASALSF